jgi:surface antigen
MRRFWRLAIIVPLLAFGLTTAAVGEVHGACANPTSGQVVIYTEWNYGGDCAVRGQGIYATLTSFDNTIASVKVGGSRRFMACQGANFGGTCTGIVQGNIPSNASEPEINFLNTISSFKVQPIATSNWFVAPQCTWGAAYLLDKNYGQLANFYPAWGGNANMWDNNAVLDFYLVDDVPAWNTIVNMEANKSRQTAEAWIGPINGGTPDNLHNPTSHATAGHVGWVVDVRTAADGTTWLHTLETNIGVDWYETVTMGNQTFHHVYMQFHTSSQKQNASIIHPNG